MRYHAALRDTGQRRHPSQTRWHRKCGECGEPSRMIKTRLDGCLSQKEDEMRRRRPKEVESKRPLVEHALNDKSLTTCHCTEPKKNKSQPTVAFA